MTMESEQLENVLFKIGPLPISETVVTTWAVMLGLLIVCWLSARRLKLDPGPWQVALEGVVGAIENAIEAVLPEHVLVVLPFVGSLWIFVVCANLVGILPGLHGPTADLSTTSALALLVFLSVHWYGIRIHGLKAYLRHYLEPNPIFTAVSPGQRNLPHSRFSGAPFRQHFQPGNGGAIDSARRGISSAGAGFAPAHRGGSGASLYLRNARADLYRRRYSVAGKQKSQREETKMNDMTWFTLISTVAAAAAIALGAMIPALAMGRAIVQALDALARQPEAEKSITRTLFIGLAMIESLAIYVLVIVLIILFRNPLLQYLLK